MNENDERSEEELDAEAHEAVEAFLRLIQVEAVIENGTVNFRVTVPVIEPVMDLSKLGLSADAPLPNAVGMKMNTEMPEALWDSQSQAMIRETVKKQAVSHLVEQGVIRDA